MARFKYNPRRVLKWLLINSAFLWMLWLSAHGNEGAHRIAESFAALQAVLLILVSSMDKLTAQFRETGFPVPLKLGGTIQVCTGIVCIYQGWMLLAFLLIIEVVTTLIIHGEAEELKTEE